MPFRTYSKYSEIMKKIAMEWVHGFRQYIGRKPDILKFFVLRELQGSRAKLLKHRKMHLRKDYTFE